MKPLAYLVEEFDVNHVLVWSGLMTSEPREMSWFKDLKSKMHNITANIIKVTKVKKYDSSRFVIGE